MVGETDVQFLGWPDGTVTGGTELRRAIAEVIRHRRPEMVLTLTFEMGAGGSVNHADHRAVGLATIDAVRDAANRWVFPELGSAWSGVQATYAFGASEPTHFVDVSDTMDAAVQSLSAHQAYLDGLGGDFDAEQFLRNNAARSGAEVGCEYAVTLRKY
jgi:LmbE family N-acetylglucosaminyl deacetylase